MCDRKQDEIVISTMGWVVLKPWPLVEINPGHVVPNTHQDQEIREANTFNQQGKRRF